MAAILLVEPSKELKEAIAKYEETFGAHSFPEYQFQGNERKQLKAISDSLNSGIPVEWDHDTKF